MKTTVWKLPVVLTATVALAGNTTGARPSGPETRTDPSSTALQDVPPRTAGRGPILEREVYTYPARGRRNPFLPSEEGPHLGAVVEAITVLGIIHHPDPLYRVAVMRSGERMGALGARDGIPAVRAASRLRIGEVFAGVRIVAIEADHVVVEREEPGGTVPGVLSMPRAVRRRES